ncbi:uncharacterized protein LDX57_008945 [Aspergillus melleus]|uniref:uncharacterized protein n=1 Tax=Aspergillus melleus TaxID=138277 RepID=UPI001E8E267B|nr:uncharacterized protein LDX57_008945 [Aspergillus melleus]KAH8431283.1 hypothetical protein LDX57_008945 [Aspergillus melleus]
MHVWQCNCEGRPKTGKDEATLGGILFLASQRAGKEAKTKKARHMATHHGAPITECRRWGTHQDGCASYAASMHDCMSLSQRPTPSFLRQQNIIKMWPVMAGPPASVPAIIHPYYLTYSSSSHRALPSSELSCRSERSDDDTRSG